MKRCILLTMMLAALVGACNAAEPPRGLEKIDKSMLILSFLTLKESYDKAIETRSKCNAHDALNMINNFLEIANNMKVKYGKEELNAALRMNRVLFKQLIDTALKARNGVEKILGHQYPTTDLRTIDLSEELL
jgi:hypothetical protein